MTSDQDSYSFVPFEVMAGMLEGLNRLVAMQTSAGKAEDFFLQGCEVHEAIILMAPQEEEIEQT